MEIVQAGVYAAPHKKTRPYVIQGTPRHTHKPFYLEDADVEYLDYNEATNEPFSAASTLSILSDTVLDASNEVLFALQMIRHPGSPEWSPADHIAKHLQVWLLKSLDKKVRT